MSITLTNSTNSKEVNLSNDNFKHLFSLIGFNLPSEGSIGGGKVEIIKNRINNIIDTIEESPEEFNIDTEIIHSNNAIDIYVGKDIDYYIRKYSALLELFQSDIRFNWY